MKIYIKRNKTKTLQQIPSVKIILGYLAVSLRCKPIFDILQNWTQTHSRRSVFEMSTRCWCVSEQKRNWIFSFIVNIFIHSKCSFSPKETYDEAKECNDLNATNSYIVYDYGLFCWLVDVFFYLLDSSINLFAICSQACCHQIHTSNARMYLL